MNIHTHRYTHLLANSPYGENEFEIFVKHTGFKTSSNFRPPTNWWKQEVYSIHLLIDYSVVLTIDVSIATIKRSWWKMIKCENWNAKHDGKWLFSRQFMCSLILLKTLLDAVIDTDTWHIMQKCCESHANNFNPNFI